MSTPTPKPALKRSRITSPGQGSDQATANPLADVFNSPDWLSRATQASNGILNIWSHLQSTHVPPADHQHIPEGLALIRSTLTKLIRTIDGSLEDLQVANQPPPPLPPVGTPSQPAPPERPASPQPAEESAPLDRSYAQATAPPPSKPPAQPPAQRSKPKKATPGPRPQTQPILGPTRLIVHLVGQAHTPAHDLSSQEVFRKITAAITRAQLPPGTLPLGVHRNKKGNLIISYPAGTSRTIIKSTFPAIRSTLQSDTKLDLSFDAHWSRIHLASIPARSDPDASVYSDSSLHETLSLNPAIRALNITRAARWIRKPDLISGLHSSAVLAFEDPDGSIARSLLKTPLFAFGAAVTVKKWLEKPAARKNRIN